MCFRVSKYYHFLVGIITLAFESEASDLLLKRL